ncbi:hypothetical protein Q5425_44115 [Amycolatopsis sp. A133]|nr:hypothetical protein [Amycolatopsis sp. A133]MDQ7810753.1 hypothetical protein [Amycolatopsis sp. A133]
MAGDVVGAGQGDQPAARAQHRQGPLGVLAAEPVHVRESGGHPVDLFPVIVPPVTAVAGVVGHQVLHEVFAAAAKHSGSMDQTGERPGSKRAPAEPEDEDPIARFPVVHQKLVGLGEVFPDADTECQPDELRYGPADARPRPLSTERSDAGIVVRDLSSRIGKVEQLGQAHHVGTRPRLDLVARTVEAQDHVLAHRDHIRPPPRVASSDAGATTRGLAAVRKSGCPEFCYGVTTYG